MSTFIEQGTDTWKVMRSGKVTASRINDVCAKIKTGEAATRRDYKMQVLAEILTGLPSDDGYCNSLMLWGTEQEPFARVAYEFATGFSVEQVAFLQHPEIERSGGSPDGLIDDCGGLELKCPKTTTHLKWMMDGVVPAEHRNQMHWNMACSGRQWWDFGSYDPRLPDHLQLFVVRLERDEQRIQEITAEVVQFLKEVDAMIAKLKEVAK